MRKYNEPYVRRLNGFFYPLWADSDQIDKFKDIVDDWPGFELIVGDAKKGYPNVITRVSEEMRDGERSVTDKGYSALIGDRIVMMTVVDVEQALATLRERSDIPLYVYVPERLIVSENRHLVRELCNTIDKYLTHYYVYERPYINKLDTEGYERELAE